MRNLLENLKKNGVQLISNEDVKGFEKDGKKISKVITTKNVYEPEEIVIARGP